MKIIKITTTIIALLFILSACNEDFLNRSPLDQVGSTDYFKNPADLETYINQFYTKSMFPLYRQYGGDMGTDNAISNNINEWLNGSNTLDEAPHIDFSKVRAINFFFDNYNKVKEKNTLDLYQQYLGEAYFFRAMIYFNLLQLYGDIQWYTSEVGTESPELTAPRTPRSIVADNIITDLDSAALYLTELKTDGSSRINKYMALLFQSRVALFEGSWEKYHTGTPFGVTNANPDKYFNKVVKATEEIINSGVYDIYSNGKPTEDYHKLYILRDYSSNCEVMFWKKFDSELGKGEVEFRNEPNLRGEWPSNHSLTKELADSYLCTDGDPISVSPLFQGYNTIDVEFKDRDPRLMQTFAFPDLTWFIYEDGTEATLGRKVYRYLNYAARYNSPAGYVNRKGYNPKVIYHVPQYEDTPGIIYKYDEVLLNYAEAKAELGVISQADVDKSIKKLRDRVGMPNLNLASITVDSDWDFPDLSPTINEIRRERRVELAGENLRTYDLFRWAAMDELFIGKRSRGFKASQLRKNPYPVDENGFLDPHKKILPDGYGFNVNRDYLRPIPKDQLLLNENLTQNPGWAE